MHFPSSHFTLSAPPRDFAQDKILQEPPVSLLTRGIFMFGLGAIEADELALGGFWSGFVVLGPEYVTTFDGM